ncbi:MAG: IS66 family transposase zinc-finger binding domain-containing protein, partial [Desulfobacteraceae bacterium]|nr:IS66 family transposase zinc-finger binding domain-containing protein [Desulfobacteraceae bacterium]
MTKEKLTQTDNLDEVKKIALNLFDENILLQEQVKSLRDRLFGRKTEKAIKDDGQLSLFDIPEPVMPAEPQKVTIAEHSRKKRGRKPLPERLPRVEVVHELTEQERQCNCGHLKSHIGQEISEQLDYIPAKVRVIRNIRYKYACKNCEGVED